MRDSSRYFQALKAQLSAGKISENAYNKEFKRLVRLFGYPSQVSAPPEKPKIELRDGFGRNATKRMRPPEKSCIDCFWASWEADFEMMIFNERQYEERFERCPH